MSERIHTDPERDEAAQRPVRDSGPGEGVSGEPGGSPGAPAREPQGQQRSGPGEGVSGERGGSPGARAPEVLAENGDVLSGDVPGPGPSELEERLAAAEAKAAEHLGDLQRLAAEFDNYRKRAAREQEGLVARAHERLVKELLPVLDDLERALEAAKRPESPVRDSGPGEGARESRVEVRPTDDALSKLEDGVRLVHRSLADILRREGLAEVEADGRFDPHVHEALLAQPSEAEEGAVIHVLQKGYRLGDRVLRPARVVVSAGAPERASPEATEG